MAKFLDKTGLNSLWNRIKEALPFVDVSLSGDDNGWCKVAVITCNTTYMNAPFVFHMLCRGYPASSVEIMFKSVNATTPEVQYFRHRTTLLTGTHGVSTNVGYTYEDVNGVRVYTLWKKKNERYGSISVHAECRNGYASHITYPKGISYTEPEGIVYAAEVLDTVEKQTAYTGKGTADKIPQITTNAAGQVTNIIEVNIGNASTATKPNVTSIPSTANLNDYKGTSQGDVLWYYWGSTKPANAPISGVSAVMRVVREHSGEYVKQTVYVTGGQVFTRKCKNGTWDTNWSDEGEVSFENYSLGRMQGSTSAGKYYKLAEIKGINNTTSSITAVFLIDILYSGAISQDMGYLKVRTKCSNSDTPTYNFSAEFVRFTNSIPAADVKVYGDTSTGVAYVYAYVSSGADMWGHIGARCILVTDLYNRRTVGYYVTFSTENVINQSAPSYTAVTVTTKQLLNSGDVTSTYSATGTAPVNGTAVASAISSKVSTYSLGTTQNTETYTMFARMSSQNAQGNGEASLIVSAAGNIGRQGEGVWLVNISNRGSTPYISVKVLQPVGIGGQNPIFGYYTDSTNGYFYFGMWTPTYRGKCDIIVLTNSGASCQDFGDTTTAPSGWTSVRHIDSYGVNNTGSLRTDAVNPAWGLLAAVKPPESTETNQDTCVQFHFSVTGAGTYVYDYGIAYVEIRHNSGSDYSATASFIRQNLTNADKFTLKFYWDATNHTVLIYGYATEKTYRGISLSIIKCTNYNGVPRAAERYVTLYNSSGTGSSAPSGYAEMTPNVGFIPRTTTNVAVGSESLPVYVKAGGEIAACNESNFDRLIDVSSYTTYASIVAVATAGHTPYYVNNSRKFYYQYHEASSSGSFVYFGAVANGRYVYSTFVQETGAVGGSFTSPVVIDLRNIVSTNNFYTNLISVDNGKPQWVVFSFGTTRAGRATIKIMFGGANGDTSGIIQLSFFKDANDSISNFGYTVVSLNNPANAPLVKYTGDAIAFSIATRSSIAYSVAAEVTSQNLPTIEVYTDTAVSAWTSVTSATPSLYSVQSTDVRRIVKGSLGSDTGVLYVL